MAIVATVDIAGGTQELYEQVSAGVTGGGVPPGELFRTAGAIPGGWRVIAGWQSLEQYETFLRETLQPAYQRAGVVPSRIDVWQVTEIVTASGTGR